MILFYNKIIYLNLFYASGFKKVVVCIVQRYVDFTIMRNTAYAMHQDKMPLVPNAAR